jgi:hypothetical protein
MRLNTMAKPKRSTAKSPYSTTFVKCELSAEDKKHLAVWMKTPPMSFDDMMVEVLQTNHKLSLSFSEHTDSFIASITGKPEECINPSKTMTSHAKDYTLAMWIALYKFHHLFKAGVWEDTEDTEDFG